MKKMLAAMAAGTCLAVMSLPAQADLIADGITYQLQVVSGQNTTTASFDLHITGINGSLDTEKGRYGVESFAFTRPDHFSSASGPTGFIYRYGGLSSDGCNGKGNFFCFDGPNPPNSVLAPNSVLDFFFTVTLSSGNFLNYTPDLKINWVGNKHNEDYQDNNHKNSKAHNDDKKNNYDLVSQDISITAAPVPGPVVGVGLPGLLACFGAMLAWCRRKRLAIQNRPCAAGLRGGRASSKGRKG